MDITVLIIGTLLNSNSNILFPLTDSLYKYCMAKVTFKDILRKNILKFIPQ